MSSGDTPVPSKRPYQTNRWFLSPIITRFNPSGGQLSIESPTSPIEASFTPQGSPVTPRDIPEALSAPTESTQTRIRSFRCSQWEKADDILGIIQNDFASLGDFLSAVFHNRARGAKDLRTVRHCGMVSALLAGESKVRAIDIVLQIYSHRDGQPKLRSGNVHERQLAFSLSVPPSDILHTRPSMSTWAAQLVGRAAHREVGLLTKNDPDDPDDCTHLHASSNGRGKNVRVATWDDLAKYSISDLATKYKRRALLSWYLTEEMAAPRKNGVIKLKP